jgi:hypothetical protein
MKDHILKTVVSVVAGLIVGVGGTVFMYQERISKAAGQIEGLQQQIEMLQQQIDNLQSIATEATVLPTHTPYATFTPYPTYTPVPPTPTPTTIPTPTPISLSFEAPICQCKDNFDRLDGDRVFLRNGEFGDLGVPVGTLVTLEVIVDGTESSMSGLILDNDTESSSCTIRLCKSVREFLNPTLNEDIEILLERRAIRQWQITVER